MKRNNKKILISLGIILVIGFSIMALDCFNKKGDKYHAFLNDFYDSYFQIAETLYHCDPEQVVNLMAAEEIQDKMSSIEELLDNIKDEVPDDKEKNYKNLSEWYQDLVIISDKKYEDWWGVTVKERITVDNILLDIAINLSDWEDEESGIIWDK
ncbi:hypothetical protein AN1V17_40730 [Vallitalea sediminicola]